MEPFDSLRQELNKLRAQGLERAWQQVEAVQGGRIRVKGRWLIHLASNSYLGLSLHPRVVVAAQEATARLGTGAGSARLIGGTLTPHEQLEEALASFKQAEAALLFPTGYMANLGIITALVGPGDLVIGDHLNHASLVDACRLSRAAFRVYPHRDLNRLAEALNHRRGRYRRILIVTEGLFSMDGDLAPLPEIADLARRTGAWLLVDDAHGTGVLGEHGRGSLEHFGISTEGILQMGTLSKALGSVGGFLAGPRVVVDYLKNKARPFIYTTALPPACAAAALEALRVVQEEPVWRQRLWENVRQWTEGLKEAGWQLVSEGSHDSGITSGAASPSRSHDSGITSGAASPSRSQIVAIRIGEVEETMKLAQALWDAGIYAPGIRPPTVPVGSARIRTSLTALHTPADLKEALFVLSIALDLVRFS